MLIMEQELQALYPVVFWRDETLGIGIIHTDLLPRHMHLGYAMSGVLVRRRARSTIFGLGLA